MRISTRHQRSFMSRKITKALLLAQQSLPPRFLTLIPFGVSPTMTRVQTHFPEALGLYAQRRSDAPKRPASAAQSKIVSLKEWRDQKRRSMSLRPHTTHEDGRRR